MPAIGHTWGAQIDVPVLIALGERDISPDPHADVASFPSSNDVSLSVVPRMAHMHNFASTRRLLWDRLEHWMAGVVQAMSAPT
jgi:pimeloyl-ACP methyl ester carboxylesterase